MQTHRAHPPVADGAGHKKDGALTSWHSYGMLLRQSEQRKAKERDQKARQLRRD